MKSIKRVLAGLMAVLMVFTSQQISVLADTDGGSKNQDSVYNLYVNCSDFSGGEVVVSAKLYDILGYKDDESGNKIPILSEKPIFEQSVTDWNDLNIPFSFAKNGKGESNDKLVRFVVTNSPDGFQPILQAPELTESSDYMEFLTDEDQANTYTIDYVIYSWMEHPIWANIYYGLDHYNYRHIDTPEGKYRIQINNTEDNVTHINGNAVYSGAELTNCYTYRSEITYFENESSDSIRIQLNKPLNNVVFEWWTDDTKHRVFIAEEGLVYTINDVVSSEVCPLSMGYNDTNNELTVSNIDGLMIDLQFKDQGNEDWNDIGDFDVKVNYDNNYGASVVCNGNQINDNMVFKFAETENGFETLNFTITPPSELPIKGETYHPVIVIEGTIYELVKDGESSFGPYNFSYTPTDRNGIHVSVTWTDEEKAYNDFWSGDNNFTVEYWVGGNGEAELADGSVSDSDIIRRGNSTKVRRPVGTKSVSIILKPGEDADLQEIDFGENGRVSKDDLLKEGSLSYDEESNTYVYCVDASEFGEYSHHGFGINFTDGSNDNAFRLVSPDGSFELRVHNAELGRFEISAGELKRANVFSQDFVLPNVKAGDKLTLFAGASEGSFLSFFNVWVNGNQLYQYPENDGSLWESVSSALGSGDGLAYTVAGTPVYMEVFFERANGEGGNQGGENGGDQNPVKDYDLRIKYDPSYDSQVICNDARVDSGNIYNFHGEGEGTVQTLNLTLVPPSGEEYKENLSPKVWINDNELTSSLVSNQDGSYSLTYEPSDSTGLEMNIVWSVEEYNYYWFNADETSFLGQIWADGPGRVELNSKTGAVEHIERNNQFRVRGQAGQITQVFVDIIPSDNEDLDEVIIDGRDRMNRDTLKANKLLVENSDGSYTLTVNTSGYRANDYFEVQVCFTGRGGNGQGGDERPEIVQKTGNLTKDVTLNFWKYDEEKQIYELEPYGVGMIFLNGLELYSENVIAGPVLRGGYSNADKKNNELYFSKGLFTTLSGADLAEGAIRDEEGCVVGFEKTTSIEGGYEYDNSFIRQDGTKEENIITDLFYVSLPVSDADEEVIDIVLGETKQQFTINWSPTAELFGEEAVVENGYAKLISITDAQGNDLLANGEADAQVSEEERSGYITLVPGALVTVELVPDYGYQIFKAVAAGQELEPDPEHVSRFTFEMPATNVYFSGIFEEARNEIDKSNLAKDGNVAGIDIANGENAASTGTIKLSAGATTTDDISAIQGVRAVSSVDIAIDNLVCKGTTDKDGNLEYWTSEVSEMEKPVEISFDVQNLDPDKEYVIIRNHNGQLTELDTAYENGKLTFESDSFSTYTIAEKAPKLLPAEERIKLHGYSVSLFESGKIGLNFFIAVPSELKAEELNAFVGFEKSGVSPSTIISGGDGDFAKTSLIPTNKFETISGDKVMKDGAYADCSYDIYKLSMPLSAAQQTDSVSITVGMNRQIVINDNYSVRDYAQTILSDTEGKYTNEIGLVKALLNYGAESQKYFDYNSNNLANNILDDKDKVITTGTVDYTKYQKSLLNNCKNITYYGSSLILKSDFTIRHYFTINAGTNISDYSFVVNGKELSAMKSAGQIYYVDIEGITANNIDHAYTLTITENATKQQASLVYSVMSYMSAAQNSNQKLEGLVKSIYAYGVAFKNYLALLSITI